ncbi:MAG: hypothetical protein JW830_15005 [Bacteroidales bacterium]|nr:hypothetical protein [Bacteroidales bacterium]
MKTTQTLFILLFISTLGSFAQKPILIYEENIQLGNNYYPGIYVTIPEVPFESVQKNWIKTMESGSKSKAVFENGNWSIFGANIKSVSPTPLNIYSRIENRDSLVGLLVSLELKKDDFVQKGIHETELTSAREFLKQFARDQYLKLAEEQLEVEEKKLSDIEKEFSSFKKQESRLEKSIRSAEKTIKKEQEELVAQNVALNSVSVEIASQTLQYNELADGTAKEERAKYLKSLDKRKSKITKAIKTSEKKIEKANASIRDANARIPQKESLQVEARNKIAAQQTVVQQYKDKVAKIIQN